MTNSHHDDQTLMTIANTVKFMLLCESDLPLSIEDQLLTVHCPLL